MDKIGLRWVSAADDSSGYAAASRSYISTLIDREEIDLTLKVVSFEHKLTDHGAIQRKMAPYKNRYITHKIQVTHLTPENYPALRLMRGYNVCYTAWETENLPHRWIDLINSMDEVWVPSQWNKEVFANSGISKPIYVIPHIITLDETANISSINLKIDDDMYVFYSIFQWIERKNPTALIKAYLTEFLPTEKVCLVLKTYRLDTSLSEQKIIIDEINNLKKSLNLTDYPQMRLIKDLLPDAVMNGLHERGNCFVLPHHAEGFSITHADAMLRGKPTIATGYSGNMEFMNEKNSFLTRYQRAPVFGMIFSNYTGDMTWANPDLMHLRELMRYCFDHQEEAKLVGQQAQRDIQEQLSPRRIGDLIVNRLIEISKGL